MLQKTFLPCAALHESSPRIVRVRKKKKEDVHQMSNCTRESCSRVREGEFSAPGDLLRHCAKYRLCWMGEKSVHRATYCAHNYPLPLLPSGPGGVGGIMSRRTRH